MAQDYVQARDWIFEAQDGDGSTWLPATGDEETQMSIDPTSVQSDVTSFSDAGLAAHYVAERAESVRITGLFREDSSTGAAEAFRARIEEIAAGIGLPVNLDATGNVGSRCSFRFHAPQQAVITWVATITMDPVAGGNNDPASWGFTVTRSGAPS